MKQTFKIFVEGDADKRFISQLLEVIFKVPTDKDSIVKTSGWNNLTSPKTEETYLNQMKMVSANGGTNLVIFDADDDFDKRKEETCSMSYRACLFFRYDMFVLRRKP